MSTEEPTPDEAVQAIYRFAAQEMKRGAADHEIEGKLIEHGLDAESARLVVRQLHEAKSKAVQGAGKKNMLFGALWCIGGTIVTIMTYAAAANNPEGGRYVIAWGAIVFGAIQFIHGLIQSSRQ